MPQDVSTGSQFSEYTDESMQRALHIYRLSLRAQLEAENMNSYVRLDPESGAFVVAQTRGQARSMFKSQYGDRVAWTLHIGTI